MNGWRWLYARLWAILPPLVCVPAAAFLVCLALLWIKRRRDSAIPVLGALCGLAWFLLFTLVWVRPVKALAGQTVTCTAVVETDADASYSESRLRGTLRLTEIDGRAANVKVQCASFPGESAGERFTAKFALTERPDYAPLAHTLRSASPHDHYLLARRLAEHLGQSKECQLLLEQPELNPFLTRFYQERSRYALQTQLFFLFQRQDQLRDLAQPDIFRQTVVSDFLFEKDPIFARLTLAEDEYKLYRQIYDTLAPQVVSPDLVIYLQASPENLIARVKKRGLDMERRIGDVYLTQLAESYSRFFYGYNAAPVMIVNSDRLNFVDQDRDFHLLLERLAAMRGHREYFNRGE